MRARVLLSAAALLAVGSCAQIQQEWRAIQAERGSMTSRAEPASTSSASVRGCEDIADAAGPNLTLSETSAQGPQEISGVQVPAHCLVKGVIDPRTGAGNRAFGIGFELRLPADWNGRFLYQGGGGHEGIINPAIGKVPLAGSTARPALARGYAVISTDAGHTGYDPSFATDQQSRIDYAYNALGRATREAKALIARHYGRAPDKSYAMGCSQGGRTALIAAQRFPTEYDGVVACDPAFSSARASIASSWSVAQLMRIAPRNSARQPVLSQALSQADLQLLSIAILQACDDKDGLSDGLIFNHAACRFDPAQLQCARRQTVGCLSAAKVQALRAIFAGPRDSQGRALYTNFPYDAGVAAGNWRRWYLGEATTGAPDARHYVYGHAILTRYFMTPPQGQLEPLTVNFNDVWPQIWQQAAATDAASTYLTTFVARGGKMIVMQGMSDPAFSANDVMAWYDRMARDTGGAAGAQAFARLFLLPGVTHCGGGNGLDDVDPLSAIEAWVEQGTAPDRMLARGTAMADTARPICPYPAYARYNGRGDQKDAANFTCQRP
ncbi:MAG: tannase/feruloyl esterase family alpha/beta hydrolase [Hyphomonadaceae bacterium]|nr:tannase/feruloyl esterase family alpha/beta hydrolase [Hyphomonadaceae bacterium]